MNPVAVGPTPLDIMEVTFHIGVIVIVIINLKEFGDI